MPRIQPSFPLKQLTGEGNLFRGADQDQLMYGYLRDASTRNQVPL